MKALLTCILLSVGFSGFTQSKQEIKRLAENRDKYLFAVKTEPDRFDATLAADFVTDEWLVPVQINGKTYTFLFDTGAITILSSQIVAEMGLQPVTSNKFVDSAGNTTEERFYVAPEIKLGPVAFRNVGVGSFDLSKFTPLLCRPIDGIFGTNMMQLCNWEIDYVSHTIRLSSSRIKLYDSASVPFEQNFSGTPRVRIDTGGINFLADVDTGNNGSLDLPMEFFEKSRLPKARKIATSNGKGTFSLLGNAEQQEHALVADSVYVGDVLLSRRIRVSPSPMALLGNDFFSPFGKFAINYKKGELLLPKKYGEAKMEMTFGFAPLRENGKTFVGLLWKDSEAEKHGLAPGDEILSLNGTALAGMDDATWCGFRQKLIENASLEITVRKRDGQTLQLHLLKYDTLE